MQGLLFFLVLRVFFYEYEHLARILLNKPYSLPIGKRNLVKNKTEIYVLIFPISLVKSEDIESISGNPMCCNLNLKGVKDT